MHILCLEKLCLHCVSIALYFVLASTRPSGNNSVPDGTLMLHPEEVDSGVVAGIFIAVAISVTILLGFVRIIFMT